MSTVTGFLTDSTLCIGCKACEVACKEWNDLGADGLNWSGFSYDNTGALGHSTWRHVKFVEHPPELGHGGNSPELASWTFSSDVCKHCENAGCLEACPTGSIVRTEFGTVYVQPDICNGCSYCVVACPFGVRSEEHTSELQSRFDLVCRLLLEKKKKVIIIPISLHKKIRHMYVMIYNC